MTAITKLDAISKHLRLESQGEQEAPRKPVAALDTGKRVQKNLTILERDAERLAAFAKRDGLSQARVLSAALDAFERVEASGADTSTRANATEKL